MSTSDTELDDAAAACEELESQGGLMPPIGAVADSDSILQLTKELANPVGNLTVSETDAVDNPSQLPLSGPSTMKRQKLLVRKRADIDMSSDKNQDSEKGEMTEDAVLPESVLENTVDDGGLPKHCPYCTPSKQPNGIMKFNERYASSLFNDKDWNKLKTYLELFVSSNPHKGQKHGHPQLFFIVLEQKVIDFLMREEFDGAKATFESDIKPLLNESDHLFLPLDLCDHVSNLEKNVKSRIKPQTSMISYSADPMAALLDYIALYFPNCIRPVYEKWEGTLGEFVSSCVDNAGVHTRCLACQWVIPAGQGFNSMVAHVKHLPGKHKKCRSLTVYLLHRVNELNGTPEQDLDFNAFKAKYKHWSRNKKTQSLISLPSVLPTQNVLSKVNEMKQTGTFGKVILSTLKELSSHHVSLLEVVHGNTSPLAKSVRDVYEMQTPVINNLLEMFCKGQDANRDAVFESSLTLLHNSTTKMRPLLNQLPVEVVTLASHLDKLICMLRASSYHDTPLTLSASVSEPNTSFDESVP